MYLKLFTESEKITNFMNDMFLQTYQNLVDTIYTWISDLYKDNGIFSIVLNFEYDSKTDSVHLHQQKITDVRCILLREGLIRDVLELVDSTYHKVKTEISPSFCWKTFQIVYNDINGDNPTYSIHFTYFD